MFISFGPFICKWCIWKARYIAKHVHRTMWNIDITFIIMKYEPTYHSTMAGSIEVTHDNFKCGIRWIMQNQTDKNVTSNIICIPPTKTTCVLDIHMSSKEPHKYTVLKSRVLGFCLKELKYSEARTSAFPLGYMWKSCHMLFWGTDVKIQV